MRLLVALVLLLAGAAAAQANSTFDTYIESLSPTNYWPETTNGNDLVGSNNPSAVGSCTFGQSPLDERLRRHLLVHRLSVVLQPRDDQFVGLADLFPHQSDHIDDTAGVPLPFDPGSNQGLAFMINTGPVCGNGKVDFRFVVSGTNY